jgi:peptidoglycan/LPS O-acetylase OafA/YrhL
MRIVLLDILRTIAIVLLLISHIGQAVGNGAGIFFGIPGFYWVSFGGFAVTIFIMLSGFVLGIQYGNKEIKYNDFLFKRFLRIYPVYYMSLIIGIFVTIANLNNTPAMDMPGNIFILIILSITGFFPFASFWGGPFVATSWFIGIIFILYIFFPLLVQKIKKNPHKTIIILFFVSIISRFILGRYDFLLPRRPIDWFPLCRIFEFGLGIYLAFVLPPIVYEQFNRLKIIKFPFKITGDLSFSLFLIHYPLLFIVDYVKGIGFSQWMAISIYLSVSLILSIVILSIDNKIPRYTFVRKLIK